MDKAAAFANPVLITGCYLRHPRMRVAAFNSADDVSIAGMINLRDLRPVRPGEVTEALRCAITKKIAIRLSLIAGLC